MKEMLVNKVSPDETNQQAKLIVELYNGDLGKHYPLMKLDVPEYDVYPGFKHESSTYTDEYKKYRLNELV